MKFKTLNMSANSQKDVGAFYGVNRTNKINDFQVSDCMNFDCENFPYFSTRRNREVFYNDEKMALICHDTDVTDDYKVTGVTDGGAFIYRGAKVVDEGCSCDAISEFLGDYVLLPEKKYVRVDTSLVDGKEKCSAEVNDFLKPVDDLKCEFCTVMREGATSNNVYSSLGEYLSVSSDSICFKFNDLYDGQGFVQRICNDFFRLYPGMFFRLKLMARSGSAGYKVDAGEYVLDANGEKIPLYEEYVCDIPDDVYMVVDDMYIEMHDGTVCNYGEAGFSYSTLSNIGTNGRNRAYVKFTARRRDTGELYDISKHFKYYETDKSLVSGSGFKAGLAYAKPGADFSTSMLWNDVYILPEAPAMLFGTHYNGRFFACDDLGVNIYYSSASEKYDFTPGTSLSDAGALMCADAGKWTAIIPYGGYLYIFKKNGMYRIHSTDGLSFYIDKIADVGTVSRDAVCVVSDILYFLSETGLYRFTGSYPQELPDSLGKTYTDGVLGGYDSRLYATLTHSGGRELIVYDADVSAYGVHDDFDVKKFVTYGGVLYGLSSDGYVYIMAGERKPTEFSLSTRKFFLSFEKKAINGIRLYFDFSGGENEKMEVFVSYDGGEFVPCFKPITSGKLKYVPIKFKKCDELCVKISGYGVFTLKAMALSLYNGGDIKQNK